MIKQPDRHTIMVDIIIVQLVTEWGQDKQTVSHKEKFNYLRRN